MSYRGNRNLLQKFREGEKRRCPHPTPGHRHGDRECGGGTPRGADRNVPSGQAVKCGSAQVPDLIPCPGSQIAMCAASQEAISQELTRF